MQIDLNKKTDAISKYPKHDFFAMVCLHFQSWFWPRMLLRWVSYYGDDIDMQEVNRRGNRFQWPSLDDVIEYRRRVRRLVCDVIDRCDVRLPVTIDSQLVSCRMRKLMIFSIANWLFSYLSVRLIINVFSVKWSYHFSFLCKTSKPNYDAVKALLKALNTDGY